MRLDLYLLEEFPEATISELYVDGNFQCHVLEDRAQSGEKVRGETRIPEGEYKIRLRDLTGMKPSPKTERYQNRFPWFSWHLWLQQVPDFEWIYIHIGNWHTDTDGCLLVGQWKKGQPMIENSTHEFKRLYEPIVAALNSGVDVSIRIVRDKAARQAL